jgi:hypothetical protein
MIDHGIIHLPQLQAIDHGIIHMEFSMQLWLFANCMPPSSVFATTAAILTRSAVAFSMHHAGHC